MLIPKYAKLENERRFLVIDCPDLAATPCRLIEDLYLANSRMRLRSITDAEGQRELKLCKKYQSADPVSGPVVNLYLSPQEHALLSGLPGRPLRKRRYRTTWRGAVFGVDVFEGALEGLVLCEAEAESPDAIQAIAFPPWAAVDVTLDPFFTGGNLVQLASPELKDRLARMREAASS